jgi:hypothetical protein
MYRCRFGVETKLMVLSPAPRPAARAAAPRGPACTGYFKKKAAAAQNGLDWVKN